MKTPIVDKASNFAFLLWGITLYVVGASIFLWKAFYLRDYILGTLVVVFMAVTAIALIPLWSHLQNALHDLRTAVNSIDTGDTHDFNDY